MERLIQIFKELGPWGLVLVVLMHLLLNGKFKFEYPYEHPNESARGISQSQAKD